MAGREDGLAPAVVELPPAAASKTGPRKGAGKARIDKSAGDLSRLGRSCRRTFLTHRRRGQFGAKTGHLRAARPAAKITGRPSQHAQRRASSSYNNPRRDITYDAYLAPGVFHRCRARFRATGPPDQAVDPLPSWNEGAAKQSVVTFVRATTDEGSPTFVPPAERIATFDNDGTLWVEQPMYTQVVFAFDRVKALAPSHPDWKTKEPFRSVLLGDRETMARFTSTEFEQVFAETHGGITIEAFQALAKQWLATARHPRFKRPYTELVYQPMLEVLRYLARAATRPTS